MKRGNLLKPKEFPFRKLLTIVFIVVFFTQINCTQFIQKSKHEGNYHVCLVEYVQGSSHIPSGRSGLLVLFAESMRFEREDFTLEIPYQNILDIEYRKNLKTIINKFPEWNNWDYLNELDLGFADEAMILLVIALFVVVMVIIAVRSNEYTYMDITYETNGQSEWCILKIKTKDISKIVPILKEMLALK